MPRGIRKEIREVSRPQARYLAKDLTEDQYEELDNRFYYNRKIQPSGVVYEWKRFSVLGKEDRQYMAKLKRHGWKEVPASRHPETAGEGSEEDETILIDGQMLMEIPEALYERNRNAHIAKSENGQRDHFKRLELSPDQFITKNKRTYETQAIPE